MRFVMKKIQLKRELRNSSQMRTNDTRESKAENNVTNLVLVSGFITVFGHILFIVYHLPFDSLHQNECLNMISSILFYFSYAFNFFIYYMYNFLFRNYFRTLFCKFIKCITFNRIVLGVYEDETNNLYNPVINQ